MKIIKRQPLDQNATRFSPELKLDYQTSLNSALNEYGTPQPALAQASSNGLNPEINNALPYPIDDTEEGLRKYQKKVFSEIIDVVQAVYQEGEEEKNLDKIRGEHAKQMAAWRMERTQANLRGGGS